MSRIDEALARSRRGAAEPEGVPAPRGAGEPPRDREIQVVEYPVEIRPLASAFGGVSGQDIIAGPAGVGVADAVAFVDAPLAAVVKSGFEQLTERVHADVLEKTVAGPLHGDSVEQYRRLAGLLHHAQEARGIKVIMVASAVPGEGKTLTAANLAITLAESFQRSVLLVDADLRRPSVHHIFRVPNKTGLSDSLLPASTGRVVPVRVSPMLSVLPSGASSTDPMSGLTSERMHQLIVDGAAQHDWVIIDTPPVALLPDANLLAAMVDGAVLVIGANSTHYTLVQRAVNAIGRDRILGVVLNRYQHDRLPGSGHYYDYYDYRSNGYGPRDRRSGRFDFMRRLWPFAAKRVA